MGVCRKLTFVLWLFCSQEASSQDFGYVTGLSKLGIDAHNYQPLYGITFGKNLNRYFGLESNLIYSQRTIISTSQADYLSFILMPKVGYWGSKFGAYYGPSIVLNPTLHHSDIKNHTYVSTFQSIGIEFDITPKISIDLKGGYDIGLTGGYFTDGHYQKYKGAMMIAGMRFRLQ